MRTMPLYTLGKVLTMCTTYERIEYAGQERDMSGHYMSWSTDSKAV